MNMGIFKNICGYGIAAMLLVAAGCAAPGDSERIAEHLESGAPVYAVLPVSEDARSAMERLDSPMAAVIFRFLGLNRVDGAGFSSSESGGGFHCGREFLLISGDKPALFPDGCRTSADIKKQLVTLSPGFAADIIFNVDFSAAAPLLKNDRVLSRFWDTETVMGKLGFSAEKELYDYLSGFYECAIVPGSGDWLWQIPDREGRIIRAMRKSIEENGNGVIRNDGCIFEPDGLPPIGMVTDEEHGVMLAFSLGNNPGDDVLALKFEDLPELKEMTAVLPDEGFACCCVDYDAGRADIELTRHRRALTVFTRDADGITGITAGQKDGFSGLIHVLTPFLLAAGESVGHPAAPEDGQPEEVPEQEENSEFAVPDFSAIESCGAELRKLGAAMRDYAAAHGGGYPAAGEISGIGELFASCGTDLTAGDCGERYIYFGNSVSPADGRLPLAADLPAAHAPFVNVLLGDGSVITVQLNEISARHLAGILQSIYGYSEAEFNSIFNICAGADAGAAGEVKR